MLRPRVGGQRARIEHGGGLLVLPAQEMGHCDRSFVQMRHSWYPLRLLHYTSELREGLVAQRAALVEEICITENMPPEMTLGIVMLVPSPLRVSQLGTLKNRPRSRRLLTKPQTRWCAITTRIRLAILLPVHYVSGK